MAVGIMLQEGANPAAMQKWFSEDRDLRRDPATAAEITQFIQNHAVKSVITTDRMIGCPHEEGIDSPDGQTCPQCPFWAHRDRCTGEVIQ